MKNVMFLTHHLWPGGAEKTVRTLSEYLNTNIQEVASYICVVYDAPDIRKQLQNVIVMEHRSNPEDSKFHKAINVLRQMKELREIKRKYHIDTCISFLPGADWLNVFSGTGERRVVSVRNLESQFTGSIWRKIYIQIAYRRCDLITTVTERVRQDVITYFGANPNKVRTIYNPVTQPNMTGTVQDEFTQFVKNHPFVYVNVAGLRKEKGHQHLLYAFRECLQSDPDCGLVIVGGGDRYDGLVALAVKLGIRENVYFTDAVYNPHEYMKQCSAFVLASDVEGMPNVVLEAMQSGLPVVATDCGAGEILNPTARPADRQDDSTDDAGVRVLPYGLLVPTCGYYLDSDGLSETREITDAEQTLAAAMNRIRIDRNLRDTYITRNPECLSLFSMEHIIKEWIDVI